MSNSNDSNKKTILIVSMTSFFGGGEAYILNLIDLLKERYNLLLLVSSKELMSRASNELPVFYEPRRGYVFYWKHIFKVYSLIVRMKIKIVILNGIRETFLTIFLKIFGIKVISVRHTELHSEDIPLNKFKNNTYIFFANFANYAVCVSQFVFDNLSKKGLKNLVHIPNWAHQRFKKSIREKYEDGLFHILTVSRLDIAKGHLDLFEACRGLENIQINLVGDGPDIEILKKKSKGLNVVFHGYKENVLPFYKKCHLLVLPSYSEGSPLCLLEGIAVGIPCIGSDIPSIHEILGKDYVFRKGSISELKTKIVNLRSKNYLFQKNNLEDKREEYFRLLN